MFAKKAVQQFLLGGVALASISFVGVSQAMAATPQASPAPQHHTEAAQVKPLGPLGSLTDLAIQRILVSDDVAASKFGTDKPIDDPAREEVVLADAKQRAITLGLDPDATVRFFQDQITASKIVQRGLFTRWTVHPEQAPTTRPDLNHIRDELDQLSTQILNQLQATQDDRHRSLACAIKLTGAKLSGVVVNHLDLVHRQALNTAVSSVCSPA